MPARDDLVADRLDDGCLGRGEHAQIAIGARRRLLHPGERADEFRKQAQRDAGDRKVLDRPLRMDAPDASGRQRDLAQAVLFDAGGGFHHALSSLRPADRLAAKRRRSRVAAI